MKKGGWSGPVWWASVAGMMAARVPEPGPARDAPKAAAEVPGGVEPHPATGGDQDGTERRSWWRRFFGF